MKPPLNRTERAPSEVQILPPYHSKKLDRNADSHQRTPTNNYEHEAPLEATGGILRNTHEQGSSNPSFETHKLLYRLDSEQS
jgi:hypothetical protein